MLIRGITHHSIDLQDYAGSILAAVHPVILA
jgi:hypothetical protein